MDNERGESAKQILLTAYTNRAVDEICGMLTEAGIDFLRLGNETSCDPRFAGHLLEQRLGERPKLVEMQRLIREIPVVVSTTMMLQSRPFIFALKHFSLCIVDEASQLLEPAIVGILARGPMDNGQWTMDNSRGTRRSALPLCSAKNEEGGTRKEERGTRNEEGGCLSIGTPQELAKEGVLGRYVERPQVHFDRDTLTIHVVDN